MKRLPILVAAFAVLCPSSLAQLDADAAKPPVAKKVPKVTEIHGDKLVDHYYWLREKKDPEVRFHAWQSIFFGITVAVVHFVLGVIPIFGWILFLPVGLAFFILWIFVMIKASRGERYKLPFIGNFAEQAAK